MRTHSPGGRRPVRPPACAAQAAAIPLGGTRPGIAAMGTVLADVAVPAALAVSNWGFDAIAVRLAAAQGWTGKTREVPALVVVGAERSIRAGQPGSRLYWCHLSRDGMQRCFLPRLVRPAEVTLAGFRPGTTGLRVIPVCSGLMGPTREGPQVEGADGRRGYGEEGRQEESKAVRIENQWPRSVFDGRGHSSFAAETKWGRPRAEAQPRRATGAGLAVLAVARLEELDGRWGRSGRRLGALPHHRLGRYHRGVIASILL